MRYALVMFFLVTSSIAFACREGVESDWPKSEEFLIKNSEWISVIEITSIEEKLLKKEYTYKVIRDLKGHNPNGSNPGKIGPYPPPDESHKSYGQITWRDKACIQYVAMDQGKQYILFSKTHNPSSIQAFSVESEGRIKKELAPQKK